ncbi:MAG: hypothetical protein LUC23_01450 [Prevotellaceae bacterium]|nr:hypothetical protein [Prevotellaceae bacterium]
MDIQDTILNGIVFKGAKEEPEKKRGVKTKAKKKAYVTGQHGSASAKMKAEIKKRRQERHKKKA